MRPSPLRGPRRHPQATASTRLQDGWTESHRLAFENQRGGRVAVSLDSGRTWSTIGSVLHASTAPGPGLPGMDLAAPGSVSAAGIQGFHLRTASVTPDDTRPGRISVLPSDHPSAASPPPGTLIVDLASGSLLFTSLLPKPGDDAWMVTRTATGTPDKQLPLFPAKDRTMVVVVGTRFPSARQITFENRPGGLVEMTTGEGRPLLLGRVIQPLEGVGRYDGTSLVGLGRVVSLLHLSWVVATVPRKATGKEGFGPERRGGFAIHAIASGQPSGRREAALVFAIEPEPGVAGDSRSPWADALPWASDCRFECRIDDGPWRALPIATGPRVACFTPDNWSAAPFRIEGQPIRRGITALRAVVPALSSRLLADAVARASALDRQRRVELAKRRGVPVVRGRYVVRIRPTDPANIRFVRLSVEGQVVAFSNVAPYDLPWDTKRFPDGPYTILVELLDSTGAAVATTTRNVLVDNSPAPANQPRP